MSIKSVHPEYAKLIGSWKLGEDSYEGESSIKDRATTYLPATSGQRADGQGTSGTIGQASYDAYKLRAVYPNEYALAIERAIGIMHRKPPIIELSPSLEPLRDNATVLAESLEQVLRKINVRQLITGRIGVLADIQTNEDLTKPVLLLYNECAITNWDETSGSASDVSLLVLNESCYKRINDFEWEYKEQYRVLALADSTNNAMADKGQYATQLVTNDSNIINDNFVYPTILGQTSFKLPFAFINSKDVSPCPDRPPLEGLANVCLAIYRGEADYRQSLFMQGQDTLVTIGKHGSDDDTIRTGSGAHIDIGMGGDAKYIGVSSTGLSEQRLSLENDYRRAQEQAGKLNDSKQKESGEALGLRKESQTASLHTIAIAGAAGLQKVLRILAEWYGDDPQLVKVTPNLMFSDRSIDGQTLVQITQAKTIGAPISDESIHDYLKEKGLTNKSYDEELSAIEEEGPAAPDLASDN